jgi:hypothetical protein
MKKLLPALALTAVLAAPATAQRVEDSAVHRTVFAAETHGSPVALAGEAALHDIAAAERRGRGRRVLIGTAAGALVGAVAGTVVMMSTEEWIAMPMHVVSVPAGAVLGALVGALWP